METSETQVFHTRPEDCLRDSVCGTCETNKTCDEMSTNSGMSSTRLLQSVTNPPKFKANGLKRPIYHVAVKHMGMINKAKTTEELELEKIKQMQLELAKHRKMAQKSLRMVQHSSVHLPLKSTCMPTIPVGFNFCTDGRIKLHAVQEPALGAATQGRDKTHGRSRKSIAVARCWQQAVSSRLAGGLPVLKIKREVDAGVASNSCMTTRLKLKMTAPQTRGEIQNLGEPNVKKTKTNATSQQNAPQKVESRQPLTTSNNGTVSRGGRPAPSSRHLMVSTKARQPGGSRPPRPAGGLHCLNRETKSQAGSPGKSRAKRSPANKLQSKVHKANPIRRYKKVEVTSSEKPLTSPVSPKFSTRFNK